MRDTKEVVKWLGDRYHILAEPATAGTGNRIDRSMKTDDLLEADVADRDAEVRADLAEKIKTALQGLAHPGSGVGVHLPSVSPYALDHINAAIDAILQGVRDVTATQVRLFSPSITDAFEEFHRDNPHVYAELVRLARQMRQRGYQRGGMKMLWEVLRWRTMMETHADDEFKLNNNYTSHYARLIEHQEPDLRGFFELRVLRSD